VSGVGFMSDAYDLFVINLVKNVLFAVYPLAAKSADNKVQQTALAAAVTTAALVGAIFGQLAFGFFADRLGRRTIFILTISLVIVGALGSATCSVRCCAQACAHAQASATAARSARPRGAAYAARLLRCALQHVLVCARAPPADRRSPRCFSRARAPSAPLRAAPRRRRAWRRAATCTPRMRASSGSSSSGAACWASASAASTR
jgi:MFS family permease